MSTAAGATPPPEALVKALSDRYALERKLGEGGMATVYVAHDLKHDRPVAIKVLRPELAAVIGAERFLAEIRTTANLQHPHVLPLFDSGEAGSFLFYVMPYVRGESLRERLDRDKQLPVAEAVRIARSVAGALDHAHRHGVIHRDIKPANILLQDGQPVVADFGIALAVRAAGGGRLTETGLSLGTPYYMSPEQATADRDPGPASDVYSLACVLYEMIAGDPPYTGSTAQAVLARILTDRPRPLTELRETVPPNVEAAVARALAKVPADRFDTAAAFAAALDDPAFTHVAHTPPAGVTAARPAPGPPPGHVSRFLPWAVAAAAAALAVWALRPGAEPAFPAAFRATLAGFEVENSSRGGWRLTISRDGRVVVAGGPGGLLYVRRADDSEFRPIAGTEGGRNPSISPDGEWVVFVRDGLHKVKLAGGPVLTVATGGEAPHWYAPDSILYSEADTTYVVGSAGGAPRTVRAGGGGGRPSMLPGARAYLTDAGGNVQSIDRRTGEARELVKGGYHPRYLPTGHLLYGDRTAQTLFAVPFDPERGELTGTPLPVLPDVAVFGGGAVQAAVSENGTLVHLAARPGAGSRDLVWIDIEGRRTALPVPTDEPDGPRISPDGRRVAYTDGEDESEGVYVYDLITGRRIRVAAAAPGESTPDDPAWSADGSRLFHTAFAGEPTLVRVDPDLGEGSAETLGTLLGPVVDASADGAWLVGEDWERIGRSSPDLLVARTDARPLAWTPYLRADWAERGGALSPDGRWMAYAADEGGQFGIWVRSFPEPGPAIRIAPGVAGAEPVWHPDGTALFFRGRHEEGPWMFRVETSLGRAFTAGAAEPLFTLAGLRTNVRTRDWDLHPDGTRFLAALGDETASGSPQATLGPITVVVNWFEELERLMGQGR